MKLASAATPSQTEAPTRQGSQKKLERRRMLEDWAFILPQLTIFHLLTIVPLFVAIPIMFTDMAQFNDPRSTRWAFELHRPFSPTLCPG